MNLRPAPVAGTPTAPGAGLPRGVLPAAGALRAAAFAGKDPLLFAYQRLDGYRDERDAVDLPWEAITSLLAEPPRREG